MLLNLSILLISIYLFGILLTLIIFKFNISAFIKSELSKKILVWIPITIVSLFFIFSNNYIKFVGFIFLLISIYFEQLTIIFKKHLFVFLLLALIPFTVAFIHLPFLVMTEANGIEMLIILVVTSSLSDVGAFFFGKFWGKHSLPKIINSQKTWEGIFGQIVGAFIGIFLLKLFVLPNINIFLFLPIGIGSAIGDTYNSFLKRKAKIRNWSNILPGHGGFTDRFSSLAGSTVVTYYFLLLTLH